MAGSTGFTFTESGTTHFSTFSSSAGTDGTTSGTASPPTFAYWSGNTYASSSAVAYQYCDGRERQRHGQRGPHGRREYACRGRRDLHRQGRRGEWQRLSGHGERFSAFSPDSAYLSGGAAGVQPNAFPAKYSFSTTSASCSDFVVYPTGAAGAFKRGQYRRLYQSLHRHLHYAAAIPPVSWAYNTGGTVTTSPILSADGSQVAFIQVSGATASLVLLKSAATGGSISAPTTLTAQASASATGVARRRAITP